MKYLLFTPPFVQLNTPYPATAQLKGWLKSCDHEVRQCDLGIMVANQIFCRSFIEKTFALAFQKDRLSARAKSVAMKKDGYLNTIDVVWQFLQGKDDTLATRIARRDFLPEAARFKGVKDDDLEWGYGINGTKDRAKHLATLYITDLSLFIGDVYDCDFTLVRYEEKIAITAPTFDAIYEKAKNSALTVIEQIALDIFCKEVDSFNPDIVGFSLPFPGTLMMALRFGRHLKEHFPKITIAMGGGYVNTELRTVTDCRLFEFIDFLLFDDGELPISTLADHLNGQISKAEIVRAKYIEDGKIIDSTCWDKNVDFDALPAPDYSDLEQNSYISLLEFTNPMHKLWSDGKWNKLTMAHGCYWAKCTFCDTKLDYIARYDAPTAQKVVDRMKSIMAQTGVSGFHFTDEAMPPKLLKEVCRIIIDEGLSVSFWGNIRFEKSYDSEFAKLLADAGCIAVSGGLEVASERVLKLINKGVTLRQAIECCAHLNGAGIMVHTYLMYGFPTQSADEAIESLETVRQMFAEGIVQSAFWHRYAMTVHSESGCNAAKYKAEVVSSTQNPFANNAIEYQMISEDFDYDWEHIGKGLNVATNNYMLGKGYDQPMRNWFGREYENPKISKRFVDSIVRDIFKD
ncbi:MAG: radical SAM protein [Rikenellaceae bacterium]